MFKSHFFALKIYGMDTNQNQTHDTIKLRNYRGILNWISTTKHYEEDFKKQIVEIFNQGNYAYRKLGEEYNI